MGRCTKGSTKGMSEDDGMYKRERAMHSFVDGGMWRDVQGRNMQMYKLSMEGCERVVDGIPMNICQCQGISSFC